jgi:uncharacterized protein (DUF58 family)
MSVSRLAPEEVERTARAHKRWGVAFGRRFFVVLIAGFGWIVPALADVRFVYAMLLWDALLLVAWVADLRHLPEPTLIRVRRSWLAPPALATSSTIRLTLFNDAPVRLRVALLDAVPSQLREAPAALSVDAPAGVDVETEYAIRPRERGETPVGDVYLRYQSVWGIAERWARADLAQTVVTYPNFDEAKRESLFLVRSRQIDVERRSRRLRGAGRFFDSLREHQPGDELRDVCWTATARRGKLVTRLYQIERSQPIWIVLDTGRLMRARMEEHAKLDRAVNAALTVAQVALLSGDRVGLLAYGRQIKQRLAPSRGAAHLRRIVDDLARVRTEESEANHVAAAARLALDQRRRSLIIWITDVPDVAVTPEVVIAAMQLARRHLVLFVMIGHRELQHVAGRRPDTVDEMYESTAAAEVAQRRDLLLHQLEARGALALEVSANLSPALVNAYLDVKQQNRL